MVTSLPVVQVPYQPKFACHYCTLLENYENFQAVGGEGTANTELLNSIKKTGGVQLISNITVYAVGVATHAKSHMTQATKQH
jgi:hypothetical protein